MSSGRRGATEGFELKPIEQQESHAVVKERQKSKFWTRAKVVTSATIAGIGAVTGVISVIPILAGNATSFSSAEVFASPVENHISEWALPDSALDTPIPPGELCGDEQLAWLKNHGEPLNNRLLIDMRNTASKGPMLALTDFGVGTQPDEMGSSEQDVMIRVICDSRSANTELVQIARLDADIPSATARFVRVTSDGSQPLPEVPIAWNLAPGETGKLEFQLFSRDAVAGNVKLNLTSRGETRELEIEGSDFNLPPLLSSGDFFLRVTSEGFQCQRVEQAKLVTCSVDEARLALQERNAQ